MIGPRWGDDPSPRRARRAGLAVAAIAALVAGTVPAAAYAAEAVPPAVSVTAVPADEGDVASVRAQVSLPGAVAVSAEIDWGDGSLIEAVTIVQLARGVDHVYGDDGIYAVSVTVTTSSGGVGVGAVPLEIANVAPDVVVTLDNAVAFPGGEFAVVRPGETVAATAEATDAGSDDLRLQWSTGAETEVRLDGVSPDPPLSPGGAFPFTGSDSQVVAFPDAGVGHVAVSATDDDGQGADASAGVVVTGDVDTAFGQGWWARQFSGTHAQLGDALAPTIDPGRAAAYLAVVAAVSSVFDEAESVATPAQAHALLAPPRGSWKERATAALLTAWLQFASGAVSWDSEVPLSNGGTMPFLDVMSSAEGSISSWATTDVGYEELVRALGQVRSAMPPPAPEQTSAPQQDSAPAPGPTATLDPSPSPELTPSPTVP